MFVGDEWKAKLVIFEKGWRVVVKLGLIKSTLMYLRIKKYPVKNLEFLAIKIILFFGSIIYIYIVQTSSCIFISQTFYNGSHWVAK